MSVIGTAFAGAPRDVQTLLVELQHAWRGVLTALGSTPPADTALAVGQSGELASAALDAWDAWARTHDAPSAEVVIGRNGPAVAPGWPAIERKAALSGEEVAEATRALHTAYDAARANGLLSRLGLDDHQALWWLDGRLTRQGTQPPQPGQRGGLGIMLGIALVLVALGGGRKR